MTLTSAAVEFRIKLTHLSESRSRQMTMLLCFESNPEDLLLLSNGKGEA
ncbi:hypothetical protein IQ268_18020 [Oculatella sp. LEGE 06141]|nr:hypothetical protein [Oculatella sp. LEGE 06141]MBE9180461.1 hypothetical protein [Oculatella sp. LEGE 06141]